MITMNFNYEIPAFTGMTISRTIKVAGMTFLSIFFGLLFTACSDDGEIPEPINQEELITTMKVVLTPEGGGSTVTLSYRDLDGDGPGEPQIEGGVLAANTSYHGVITLLNETKNPAEDITLEVEEEALNHQFFFSNTFGAEVVYLDKDEKGNPVGIRFELQTTGPGSGSLTIALRHEPDKKAEGVSQGNIENAGGETDISVTFGIEVQ